MALRDYPDVTKIEYEKARHELLLALRHKVIPSTGNLEVFDERCSVFKNSFFFGDENWDEYLSKYHSDVGKTKDGHCFIGHSISIPAKLWEASLISWKSNCLVYSDGPLQARFLTVHVPTKELFSVFGHESEKLEDHQISENEKKSLLKLVAAMSIEGYRFNPNNTKNAAIADIASDLEKLGIPLDKKTIRKWLRESSELIAKEYQYSEN